MTEVEFWSKVGPPNDRGCREWLKARQRSGYGVSWWGGWKLTHRLAWELTNGPIPKGLQVCHHCDNPPCCEISHLFLGTPAENREDSVKKGRRPNDGWQLQLSEAVKKRGQALKRAWERRRTNGTATGIWRHPEEAKKKVSLARKGKPLSWEHRQKLSLAKLGKKQTPEFIAARFAKKWAQKKGGPH